MKNQPANHLTSFVDHLTARLGFAATAIRTPERFGLATAR